jgi:putative glutamine amidotransferase
MTDRPRIVVTVAAARHQPDPDLAALKNELYLDALRGQDAEPIPLDTDSSPGERTRAFESMDGLLLSGGVDIDPARYHRPNDGSVDLEPDRDVLEADAWAQAERRGVPVLGICRGFQAINVFARGTLLQDVGGHRGPAWGAGPALTHPIRLVPGTRLARILSPTNIGGGTIAVNSYHHQAVRRPDLAAGLIAAASASSPAGEIVEALESDGERLILAVQCHPERTESTPRSFDRLWRFFVDACRGAVSTREVGASRR